MIVGSALHLAVQVPGLVRERMRFRFVLDLREAATREVGRLMAPRVLGLAATQANFLITTTFFASKVGSTAISGLTFAWLIANLPVALFGMAFSTAAFPTLAQHTADDDNEAATAVVSRVLRIILFLSIPSAIGLALLREPVTTVLLERGEFTSGDTAITAAAVGFFCLGVVPQAGIEIHSRGFYALGDTRTPVALAVLAVAVNAGLSAILWERYEVEGLALALSVSSWLEWVLLYRLYVRRTASGATAVGDLARVARFGIAAAAMAVFLAVALTVLDAEGMAAAFVTAAAGAVAGGAVFAAVAHYLQIDELTEARTRVLGLLRRRGGLS